MDLKIELNRWRGIAYWMSGRLSVTDPSHTWDEWIKLADESVCRLYKLDPLDIESRTE